MKQQIQKLASLNKSVVDLIKEEKMDEVVAKLSEIQELTKEMETLADATPAPTDTPASGGDEKAPEAIAKAESIAKAMEEIEKWASLNITADTVKALMDQFGEFQTKVTGDMTAIVKRVEEVEKAKGISKQAGEQPPTPTSVWA